MSPLGFLPVLAFLAFYLALAQSGRDRATAFIQACLIWGVYAVLTTEALTPSRAATRANLIAVWGIPTLAVVGLILWRWRGGASALPRFSFPESSSGRLAAAGVGMVVVLTAIVAWFAPPNTWDALNYHMSRVAHWAQAGSVAHYATGNEVQNYMPPGASILALQLYVLGQDDRLANFVQWFSMIGCLIVTAQIAGRLGAGERGRWIAAAFVATLPAGIMQATGVMTDYVVALWVAIAALSFVQLWQGERDPIIVLQLGASAGLAIATKPTAAAYLAPFAILLPYIYFRQRTGRELAAWAVLGLLLLALINVGPFARNLTTYGNLAGPASRLESQMNQIIDGRVVLSNLLRNASLHAGTPSPYVNKAVALAVRWVHGRIGLDVDDPRTTSEGRFRVRNPSLHETVEGNLAHAMLLVVLVFVAWRLRRRIPKSVFLYATLVGLTFVMLSAMFQWKPTGARYHLPFFVLMAPAAAVVLETVPWRPAAGAAIAILLLASVPWLLGNHSRPLVSGWPEADVDSVLVVPRRELIFANAPYLARPYGEMVTDVQQAGCRKVAVVLPGGGLEYPLWYLLGAPRDDLVVEWLVGGTASARYTDPDFTPCAVVCQKCPESWSTVRGLPQVYHYGSFRLFLERP